MKIIVGLGNPGRNFTATRHNVGFWCIDALARRHAIRLTDRRRLAAMGAGHILGHEVTLARTRTYMNDSGLAVRYLVDRFHPSLPDLLIIYDDLDLPMGTIRLRPKGSDGGHRGMASVIGALGSQDFPRLRIGIGRPPPEVDEVEYVLGRFSSQERPAIEEAVTRAADAVEVLLEEGLEAAMNRFN